jgi:hypothetical protein
MWAICVHRSAPLPKGPTALYCGTFFAVVTSGDVADLTKETLKTTIYEEFYCLLKYLYARNSNRKIQQHNSVGGGEYDMFDEIGSFTRTAMFGMIQIRAVECGSHMSHSSC